MAVAIQYQASSHHLIFNDTLIHGKAVGVIKFYEGQINCLRKIWLNRESA